MRITTEIIDNPIKYLVNIYIFFNIQFNLLRWWVFLLLKAKLKCQRLLRLDVVSSCFSLTRASAASSSFILPKQKPKFRGNPHNNLLLTYVSNVVHPSLKKNNHQITTNIVGNMGKKLLLYCSRLYLSCIKTVYFHCVFILSLQL